ncbi:hypothetical protein H310_10335 [Aphanomyces invadans]|uniref:Major facilitator superfamily (MFS) profile domain-containing protein n=1 Tax=Aphanomyces invadans TaxID=157072 RepID=A0A024TRL6_9STRA|nr:hypothetical protein H310_10335 [Aphanomyces invadans]ETV96649.1 hypothetical protein H310_10335 [Aphanomyces invadans]|eukprot:XP_008874912.1 hypothetical protein H310_10335 [Aphanomyces invadans]
MATNYNSISRDLSPIASSTSFKRRTARWYFQMFLINFIEFAAESSRGIVMPTLFLYCQSLGGTLVDMGLLTSMFSVGRLISSFVFGWMCDRYTFRTVYILSSSIGILGNVIYLFADSHVLSSLEVLLVSRFIVGFGAGNRSVCRADVARMTSVEQRLKYITILCMVVFLGYALTPGMGAVLVGVDTSIMGLHLHELTAPGFTLTILNLMTLLFMILSYDESMNSDHAPVSTPVLTGKASKDPGLASPLSSYELPTNLVYIGVGVFIVLNIIGRGILSIFETINVPLYLDVTGYSNANAVTSAASFQFNMGLLGLLSYLSIEMFRHKITDTAWLLIGLSSLVVGNALLYFLWPLTFNEMAIGVFFVWSIGSPLITAVSVAAFSKILGSRQQGTWMGILGSSASVSRIVLPLLPAVFATFDPMFLISLIMSSVGIVLLVWYERLVHNDKAAHTSTRSISMV